MAQLNITLNQDEILQLLVNDRDARRSPSHCSFRMFPYFDATRIA